MQDSIGLTCVMEEKFRDRTFPAKIKIGVSGCPRCCSESHTRDIGLIGTPDGWTVLFGGNAGTRPRFGDLIARDLSADEAIVCAERLTEYYRNLAKPHERPARFMEYTVMETLNSELLSLIPYIPLEKLKGHLKFTGGAGPASCRNLHKASLTLGKTRDWADRKKKCPCNEIFFKKNNILLKR
jgi:Nitrite and sulphite reductase 4Fe-4S domain